MTKIWKTFPCKNCLIKRICKKTCFKVLKNDVKSFTKYKLALWDSYICIACGSRLDVKYEKNGGKRYKCHGCAKLRISMLGCVGYNK